MPPTQTSTAINACDASIWLDNASNVLKDISGSSNEVTMNFDKPLGEFKTFGSPWKKRLECGKDADFSLVCVYSTAADEALSILKNWFFASVPGDRTLKVYIPDKDIGSDVYSGEFKLENLKIPVVADESKPIMVSASLKPNGPVTLVTNAT